MLLLIEFIYFVNVYKLKISYKKKETLNKISKIRNKWKSEKLSNCLKKYKTIKVYTKLFK